ncbi:hypothetical protein IF1G_02637 [Cordyceps javanica]|uniref:Uncharacterized protein n=1 Tax=Cordyceps javanica TaxID=43265 RepID=A0A545VA04_9HYPO|nr:hypothetical protein IF1G_02637 [Cordyceps javanica]
MLDIDGLMANKPMLLRTYSSYASVYAHAAKETNLKQTPCRSFIVILHLRQRKSKRRDEIRRKLAKCPQRTRPRPRVVPGRLEAVIKVAVSPLYSRRDGISCMAGHFE